MTTISETKKALVLLDFDGVISPIDRTPGALSKENGYQSYRLGGFTCWIHENVIVFLNALNTAENVEVKWCSSWVDITENFHDKSNGAIPHFPYLPIAPSKPAALKAELKATNAEVVVAVDDYTSITSKYRKIQDDRLTVIKPKTEIGLTRTQMNKILSLVGLPKL